MTREEAIKKLEHYRYCLKFQYGWYSKDDDEAFDMAIKALEQQPCGDCISRQAVIEQINCWIGSGEYKYTNATHYLTRRIQDIPSVSPQPEVGRWIYDKNIDNWRCSECGETPKTMGYCGAAAFMAEHFKYCNHCGCKMQEVEG